MIHPRVLFNGDPAAATPWVGIAKKLARECYSLKIPSKIYQLGVGIKIRVENIFPVGGMLNGISKVWIDARAGLHGFQFIYSGEIADYREGDTGVLKKQGSAVWVSLPPIEYRNGSWTLPDWSIVSPKATGSTIELRPGKTEIDDEVNLIQKVKLLVQANLIPEPLFLFYNDFNKKPVKQIATAWTATEGEIYNLGVFSDYRIGTLTDIGYDLHPTPVISTKPKMRAPESDWPDNCGMQLVGNRRFIIMVDGSGTFHCWKDQYEGYEDLTPPSSYAAQAYRVNLSADQVKTDKPAYPDWVHTSPDGFTRRDSDFPHPENTSSEPRYVWRFSPDGKKVVGHLLKRDNETRTVRAMTYGDIISTPYDLMELQMNASAYDGGETTWQNVTFDTPGWVEFSIDITVSDDNFNFTLSLLRHEVAGTRYPIAVGYIGPCYLGWDSRGIAASPGDLVILDLRVYTGPITDQQITDAAKVYSGVHTDSTTQSIVAVYNVDTAQDLMTFSVREVPDGHYFNRFNFDSMSAYEYTAKFLHINLSTLSFVIRAEYDSITKGDSYYSFTTEDNTAGSGVQRQLEMEVGLRAIVYGQTVYEETHGGTFGALSKLAAGVGVSYTKLSLDKEGYRRINNVRKPLWSTNGLLSSFCYLMAKYLPSNSQPDPTYDTNDPCASWTDYWGTTRTNTLSFVDEVAPAVLDELPTPLTTINPNYTTEYWDTYIIPKAWDVYTTTQAMRSAGDILLNRNEAEVYRHASSVYYTAVFASSDSSLKSWDSLTINHYIDNYPVGIESYGSIWQLISCNDARFSLQVSWDGYYSLWLYDRYVEGVIPQVTFHIATISQKPIIRKEIDLVYISSNDSQFSKTNKPLATQFKFTNTGFISHILSDVKLEHAKLYSIAYDAESATLRDPEVIIIDNDFNYLYTTKQDVKINGLDYESYGYFFSYAHDAVNPVLVGSAYFVDY